MVSFSVLWHESVTERDTTPEFKRYEKQVPGHRIQVDVKFLQFKDKRGCQLKRFQYTAINEATQIRALKIFTRHTQANAIEFINEVVEKFPFRIHTIQTDNGPEFISIALTDWAQIHHVGLEFIKPGKPTQNYFVERFNRTYRTELLNQYIFKSLFEVRAITESWIKEYNEE